MHLDLVDVLRCPAEHDESPVVALPEVSRGRSMITGVVGCPVCSAEYRVVGGVLRMGIPQRGRSAVMLQTDTDPGSAKRLAAETRPKLEHEPPADFALRLAAMLDLTPGRSFAVIAGSWATCAHAVRALTPVPLVLLNPPSFVGYEEIEDTSVVEAPALPFLRGSVPAFAATADALEAIGPEAAWVALSPRARLVLTDQLDPGTRFALVATDAGYTVHERIPDPLVVSIGRSAR